MYRIVFGKTDLPDAAAFIELLNALDQQRLPEARRLFDRPAHKKTDKHSELVVTRAPGRLDVMGGIADYSGSLVLELPIREATFVALQRDPARQIRIVSLAADSSQAATFEMSLTDFESAGRPVVYEVARAHFQRDSAQHWAAYVAGVFLVLM